MDAERLKRVQEMAEQARKIPPADRSAFFEISCDDPAMQREVEKLLAHEAPTQDMVSEVREDEPGPEQPSHPMIGGRYEVLGKLGEGGMGAVFKVRDHKVGKRLIALKRVARVDERALERFEQEIDSAANLNHRNICKVYDRGEDDDGPYFTMELLTGGSLRDRVAKDGPLGDNELVDLARQLAQALRYAHRKSVQHRDIKPSNVMFAEDGDPKLADFGLARVGNYSGLSVTDAGLGTPGFSAPEQLRDSKGADHRADIYGLGATLYYAMTGRTPHGVIDPSDLSPYWQPLILKCMKEDSSERYFDAEGILAALEEAPTSSGREASEKCTVCSAENPTGSSFCRQCGAGLTEPCPGCRAPNRTGQKICRNCNIDIPKRWASDKWLQEARQHMEKRDYRRAERAASEVLTSEPDRAEAQAVLVEAREMQQQLETLRDTAKSLESSKQYGDADLAWKQLLEVHPQDRQAQEAVERIPSQIFGQGLHEKATAIRTAINERKLTAAMRMLQELRTFGASSPGGNKAAVDQVAETLRRTMVLHLRDAFDQAITRRLRKAARAAVGMLTELHVEQSEVSAMLDRLRIAERRWRRRRRVRRLVGVVAVAVILGAGYLFVADRYNDKLAREAATALSQGREPTLEGFLPSWPRDPRIVLAERAELCHTLDGRYGSNEWRSHLEDKELFNSDRDEADLIARYNWLVLGQVAEAAGTGSDADMDHARSFTRRIAWEELGDDGDPFRHRQEVLDRILAGWYDGALSLEVFADPNRVGDPALELVAEQGSRIADPLTDCVTIESVKRLLNRLDLGGNIPDQLRAHNERVLETVAQSIDDPGSVDVDDLLSRICIDDGSPEDGHYIAKACERLLEDLHKRAQDQPAERPKVLALLVAMDRGMPSPPPSLEDTIGQLVHDWNAELFPAIGEGFEAADGSLDGSLAELGRLSEFWSYLDDGEARSLRRRERRLRDVNNHWAGRGPLSVEPLNSPGGAGDPWPQFTGRTERQAIDAFYGQDLARARRLAGLLGDLDHETAALGDLESRFAIHETLADVAAALSPRLHEELGERLFRRDPRGADGTAELATDLVIAAIESGAFDAALWLMPISNAPELEPIARSLAQIEDLPGAALLELEGILLPDPRLPNSADRVRRQVMDRLGRSFPHPAELQSPGQLSFGAGHKLNRVTVQLLDGTTLDLDPLQPGKRVYRVPFLEAASASVVLSDPFDVEASRAFRVVHSKLTNPADVTFENPRVVDGQTAVMVIRPRLDFERVTVEDRERRDALVDKGDHWTLDLDASLASDQPAANLRWAVRLVTPEGVQNVELPLTVVARQVVEAQGALQRGQYEEVFDLISVFAHHDHEAIRDLVHDASTKWLDQLRAVQPATRAEADALVEGTTRFRQKVPAALHQDVVTVHDRAWIRGIDLTTRWNSAGTLRRDLAFLNGLEDARDKQKPMTAWLRGAAKWAEPIVDRMERRAGDWSTVTDANFDTFPAVLVHRITGLEFVYVPQGTFWIGGSSKSPQETPHRSVTLTGFYVSRTECTQEAWEAGPEGKPSWVRDPRFPKTDISFDEAVAWCRARGLDLVTEAQWELAAGGTDSLEYPWGGADCDPNVKRLFRGTEVAEVGTFACDMSPYGVVDLAGNVREWCYPVSNATYRVIAEGADDPPARTDGVVIRGASWLDPRKDGRTHARVFRHGAPAEVGQADVTIGFRPVLVQQQLLPTVNAEQSGLE